MIKINTFIPFSFSKGKEIKIFFLVPRNILFLANFSSCFSNSKESFLFLKVKAKSIVTGARHNCPNGYAT